MFEDGDVVGFIGDSITQVEYTGISYQEFIYNYYITQTSGLESGISESGNRFLYGG